MSLTERYLCKAFKFQVERYKETKKKKKEVLREEKEGCEYLGLGTVLALVKNQPIELMKKLKSQGAVWFFENNHSSLLTQFSSLITHHLKYPNFLYPTRLAHVFIFSSLKFSTVCGTRCLSTMSVSIVSLPTS